MNKKYFYIPLTVVGALTILAAVYVKNTDPTMHALQSALYVNLLASGITVIATSLLIDRAIRKERSDDSKPGLKFVNELIAEEVERFLCEVGYAKDAMDANAALGSTLDMSKRDLKAEYRHGLEIAKTITTADFTGTNRYTGGWFVEPITRVVNTLDEVLSNFSYVLNYTDMTFLYKLKKELASDLVQIKQNLDDDLDFVEGRFTQDEGYVSNRDVDKGKLSSYKAYQVKSAIKRVLMLHNRHFKSPST
jgi:hypothetical protein